MVNVTRRPIEPVFSVFPDYAKQFAGYKDIKKVLEGPFTGWEIKESNNAFTRERNSLFGGLASFLEENGICMQDVQHREVYLKREDKGLTLVLEPNEGAEIAYFWDKHNMEGESRPHWREQQTAVTGGKTPLCIYRAYAPGVTIQGFNKIMVFLRHPKK